MSSTVHERIEEQQIRDVVFEIMTDATKKAAFVTDPDAFIAARNATERVQRVLQQLRPVLTHSFAEAVPQSWWYK